MTVFSVLIAEMQKLKRTAETKFYGPLTLFGQVVEATSPTEETKSNASSSADGADKAPAREPIEHQMGKFLPFLQDLANFCKRVNAVVRNCVAQLACLYHERMKLYNTTFKTVELDVVFHALGEMCTVLVTIDTLISSNIELINAWTAYKLMMKYARSDPEKYKMDSEKLSQLDQLIVSLDERVMHSAFLALLNQDYSLPDPQNPNASAPNTTSAASAAVLISGNRVFSQTFVDAIDRGLARVKAGLAEPMETYERSKIVDLYSLYALYRALFRSAVRDDPKLFKRLWEVQLQVPMVVLAHGALWFIADFLANNAPAPDATSLKPAPKEVVKTRKELLANLDEEFNQQTQSLYLQLCIWMVRMESELLTSKEHSAGALLNARAKLLIHGLLLANKVRNLLLTSIHLRLHLRMPFQSRNLRSLAICVEMLKAIQLTYRRRMAMVSDNVNHMIAQTSFTLRKIFAPIKEKLEKRDRLNDTKADVYSAVSLAFATLEQPPTRDRRVVLGLALSVSQMKSMLKSPYDDEVRYQIWKLDRLATFQETIARLCDTSVLYWTANLVPQFLKDVAQHPDQTHRLQYIFSALRDCSNMLRVSATSPEHGKALAEAYEKEVLEGFREGIINPLARQVETDLRLHIHSVVLNQESLRSGPQTDFSTFLSMKPIRIFNHVVDIREQVTHYLDSTFYNHNTVALHDAKIYADMRNLAKEKFNLMLAEVHLPGSAHYSEALDVLEIMRNIHIFVARYNYNMNTQVFVERAVDQKHLNVIDVPHIANSIRTHGMGIMNTTVNFTYQFLCRKFQLVNEFLFDDHITSPLQRDIRTFRQNRDTLENRYPYAEADRFVKDIRKLGVTKDGLTFLDQFRLQVTEIGNALGYVRMVRSGGLHHASSATKFIPDLSNIVEFEPLCANTKLSPDVVVAAKNLDMTIDDLSQNVAEGTEYFLVLVRIFQSVFKTDEHVHLKNFFGIVPAITINYVDAMMSKKENLHKRMGRSEAAFTDDGLALGLAYILRMLEQDEDFDSLHWFESVTLHLKKQRADLEVVMQQSKNKGKTFDISHTQVAIKRVDAIMVEFELLSYSLTGARIFFRDITKKDSEDVGVASAAQAGAAPSSANGNAGRAPGSTSTSTSSASSSSSAANGSSSGSDLTDVGDAPSVDYGALSA